ncbi:MULTISPECIES: hypothetical protein [Mycobacteroides]|uniref:hypothetical protein n=1 Tax=Mycobacteroides TaxID=670516 RepID=UPI0008A9D221|nr:MULTISPECIES: hypothetical protein [Mycobacteroides]AYM42042.1 hypothetical protein DYE20_11185 [[Mycobacterium] chelonae subsp. gwanakae]OHU17079.1 hypothetical protein BKG75_00200 [Mycobacteroides chelonae]
MPKATCIADGCHEQARARKRCIRHYHQWRRSELKAHGSSDPRLAFCERLSEFLDEAPDGLLTEADRRLTTAIALTAATAARGIVPITPELRRQLLHAAVDALDVPEIVAEAQ